MFTFFAFFEVGVGGDDCAYGNDDHEEGDGCVNGGFGQGTLADLVDCPCDEGGFLRGMTEEVFLDLPVPVCEEAVSGGLHPECAGDPA